MCRTKIWAVYKEIGTKSGPLPVSVGKVLLELSHVHLYTGCHGCCVGLQWQMPVLLWWPHGLKYLLSHSFQSKCVKFFPGTPERGSHIILSWPHRDVTSCTVVSICGWCCGHFTSCFHSFESEFGLTSTQMPFLNDISAISKWISILTKTE